jgi:hypothetical protein
MLQYSTLYVRIYAMQWLCELIEVNKTWKFAETSDYASSLQGEKTQLVSDQTKYTSNNQSSL